MFVFGFSIYIPGTLVTNSLIDALLLGSLLLDSLVRSFGVPGFVDLGVGGFLAYLVAARVDDDFINCFFADLIFSSDPL